MKKQLMITFLLVGLNATLSFGFNIEDVFESTWKGRCKQYTDLFQNGYAIIDYELSQIDFDPYMNTFTGRMTSDINIDYTHYLSVINITGSYNSSNHEVRINPGSIVREDGLPNGLYWVYLGVKATLYMDANRSGYYLIQGYTVNEQGYNESQIEFSDHPYFI